MGSKANRSLPSFMGYSLECTSNNGKIAEKLDIRIINVAGNLDHVHLLYETNQIISQVISEIIKLECSEKDFLNSKIDIGVIFSFNLLLRSCGKWMGCC